MAEVVGTAISLEILFGIPLLYGVVITVLDVLIILMAYHKDGSMKQTKFLKYWYQYWWLPRVCFILELFKCNFEPGSGWKIFKGFYRSIKKYSRSRWRCFELCDCWSDSHASFLVLGSALVQPRLKEYDETHGTKANVLPVENEDTTRLVPPHQPVEGRDYAESPMGHY